MDEFTEYARFPSLEDANNIIAKFESNDIAFRIDDRRESIAMASFTSPLENQLIILVRMEDLDKINSLLADPKDDNRQISFDHFLHTFSDEDLIEVVTSNSNWSKEEQSLAQKIITERGIEITAEKVKSIRKYSDPTITQFQPTTDARGSAGWFLVIGVLSIFNTLVLAFESNFRFIFGLGITQIVDSLLLNSSGVFRFVGMLINIGISSLFLVIYRYAKQKNGWAYIAGLTLYGLDALIFLVIKDWLGLGFHTLALFIIGSGFVSVRKQLV